MNKVFCYAIIDLISKNESVSIKTITENAKQGNIIKFVDDLTNRKFKLIENNCKKLNESIQKYDFDAVDSCDFDFNDNGLLKLLALIVNYEFN